MPERVLIPLQVLEGETVSLGMVDILSDTDVVLLGYHEIPEQTPTEQFHMQFGEKAQQKLDDVIELFEEKGQEVKSRIVFTHDAEQTINRVAEETDCGAYLITNPSPEIEDVLLSVHETVDIDRVTDHAAGLLAGRDINVTVFGTVESDAEVDAATDLVEQGRDRLVEHGVDADAIETMVEVTDTRVRAMTDRAVQHDLVVMGERAPSLRSLVFGEDVEQVAEVSVGPVLVVRREVEE